MAIGAFTVALLVARSGWPLEPAALAGAAAALVAGVRLRAASCGCGAAFVAVSTWLLAWLVWLFLLAFPSVSGGSQGLILPPKTLLGLDATPTVHFEVGARAGWSLTALAIAAARRGAPGLELLRAAAGAGARDLARRAARARRRLGAFAATAALAGLAGALAVQLAGVADPDAYDPFLSFKLLVAVLLGGAAATLGPAAGVARPRADRPRVGAVRPASASCRSSASTPPSPRSCSCSCSRSAARGSSPGCCARLRPRRAPAAITGRAGRAGRAASARAGPASAPALTEGVRRRRRRSTGWLARAGPGETSALIGPNGSGKTTALRLISRRVAARLRPGRARRRATSPTSSTAERVRLGIARTLQTTSAFRSSRRSRTCSSAAASAAALRRPRADRARHAARPRARRRPRETAALAGARGRRARARPRTCRLPELTSSQRRLVALAAALATRAATSCSWTSSPPAPVPTSSTASPRSLDRIRARGVARARRRAQPPARPRGRRSRRRAGRRRDGRRGLGGRSGRQRRRRSGPISAPQRL